jgi:maleylacetoacetate isomerase
MSKTVTLHGYWRSSAAWRVRIALALKNIATNTQSVNLLADQQTAHSYRELNPQGLVPTLQIDDWKLGQSLAILEYLEEIYPTPALLPTQPRARAEVRAMMLAIACDIHPLNNLRVQRYLRSNMAADDARVSEWIRHWITTGFEALEQQLNMRAPSGRYLFGDSVTLADVCLLPQAYNAVRFGVELGRYPRLNEVCSNLSKIEAFVTTHPDRQSDAVPA